MDDPRPQLQAALKTAMKSKDTRTRDVIRMAMSAIKQVEVDTRKELSAEDVVAILQKEAKVRQESIDENRKAGRDDEAVEQEAELKILESFLPEQMSADKIRALAQDAIQKTGATSPQDMGKIMGVLMPQVKGLADGKLVNQIVRELLSS